MKRMVPEVTVEDLVESLALADKVTRPDYPPYSGGFGEYVIPDSFEARIALALGERFGLENGAALFVRLTTISRLRHAPALKEFFTEDSVAAPLIEVMATLPMAQKSHGPKTSAILKALKKRG